jgi:hypothetical protein
MSLQTTSLPDFTLRIDEIKDLKERGFKPVSYTHLRAHETM